MTKTVYNPNCYICTDGDFSRMGLPLCYACLICGGHVAADEVVCDKGHQQPTCPLEDFEIRQKHGLEISQLLLDQVRLQQG